MKIFLETERLILREIQPEDAAGMFELDSEKEVHRYLGNKPIHHIEEASATIEMIRKQYAEYGIGRWAVIEKSTGDFMGWAGLKFMNETRNNHSNYYDLGYRIIRRYWGKGIATEAALASLEYGFEKMGLNIIYGMAHVDNLASNKILQKCGLNFVETFDFENIRHHWYESSRADWEAKNIVAKNS